MEAITREEQFMAAAAGQAVKLPEPITRREKFLKAIADAVQSGGVTDEQIEAAVEAYMAENPVEGGGSGNLKWKQVFDFTVEEEVTSLTISVKEIIEQLKNAPFMRIEFHAAPVSSADVLSATTGKGTLKFQSGAAGAETWITDGVFLPGHVQGTSGGTVSGDFSLFRQGTTGGVNTTTIRTHQANRNFSYKYNQVCNFNARAGDVDHRFTISTTESAIGVGSTFKIFII